MALSNAFWEYVNQNNIYGIRVMMKNSLLFDSTFKNFDEMQRAASNIDGLYDEHDGTELNYNRSSWTEEYMNQLMIQVVDNFSHERLEHLKQVVRYLRTIPEQQEVQKQKYESAKAKGIGAGVGAVVGAAGAAIAGAGLGVGIAVTVVGAGIGYGVGYAISKYE